MDGYIYILVNELMPDLVKIGRTERDVDERARELSAVSGVPVPFTVAATARVSDVASAEAEIHRALSNFRVSVNREFFRLPVCQAQETMALIAKRYPDGPLLLELLKHRDAGRFHFKEYWILVLSRYNGVHSPAERQSEWCRIGMKIFEDRYRQAPRVRIGALDMIPGVPPDGLIRELLWEAEKEDFVRVRGNRHRIY